jgi:hypothetical protein
VSAVRHELGLVGDRGGSRWELAEGAAHVNNVKPDELAGEAWPAPANKTVDVSSDADRAVREMRMCCL